ncbi:MAG: MFS transporter [Aggregatilineales bacterium]
MITSSPGSSLRHKGILSALTEGFHALRVRNYRLFISGQAVSLTGSWMQTTAQAWLVVQLTNSPFALGLVGTLQFLPVTILALYGGVLADRLPKRRTLIVTQTLLLIQATIFGLLVATNAIQLWHIYVLAVTQGIVSAIDIPVRQAFSVEMVGREELANAVALNSMTFNGARIIGPSLAGIIIAGIGIAPTLFLNAASFVAVIAGLLMMRESELFAVPPHVQGSVRKRLVEGLSYVWRTPNILAIIIVVAALGTFGYNFGVVLPLLAQFVLHTDSRGFGLLSSFLGIGSFVAAISTAYFPRVMMRRLLVGAALFSVLLGAVSLSPIFWLSAALLAALGMSSIIFSTSSNTLLQLAVPDELRGRVMSVNVLLVMGSTPIGNFLIGTMSAKLGVPVALLTCAILCLVGVIGAVYYQRTPGYARGMASVVVGTHAASDHPA